MFSSTFVNHNLLQLLKNGRVNMNVSVPITPDLTSFFNIFDLCFLHLPSGSPGAFILETLTSEYVVSSGVEVVSVQQSK